MNKNRVFFYILVAISMATRCETKIKNQVYICTASDEQYYPCLINLIGSLHKHNYDEICHIAVFDLGLAEYQKEQLANVAHLSVYKIEETHPHMLTRYNTRPWGKPVPGWYTWKPVILKQAFDLFGFDSVILYVDAGTTILNNLSTLFEYIKQNGYFFHNGADWQMKKQTTQFTITNMNLNDPSRLRILDQFGLESGFMGVTTRVYEDFVVPAYELSKDIRFFEDDGTCPGGFGNYRHDQTIFSLFALLNGYKIHHHFEQPRNLMYLDIAGLQCPFHIACIPQARTPQTNVYCARFDVNPAEYVPFIRLKGSCADS